MEITTRLGIAERLDVEVVLFLNQMRVHGTVHLERQGNRFSDMWDFLCRQRRKFIPLTDVTLRSSDGCSELGHFDFMVVDKDEIKAAHPLAC